MNCKIGLTDFPAGDERLSAFCTSDACMEYVGCLRELLESSAPIGDADADYRAQKYISMSRLCNGGVSDTCLSRAKTAAMEGFCDDGSGMGEDFDDGSDDGPPQCIAHDYCGPPLTGVGEDLDLAAWCDYVLSETADFTNCFLECDEESKFQIESFQVQCKVSDVADGSGSGSGSAAPEAGDSEMD